MKRTIEINDSDIIADALRDFRMFTVGMYIKPQESFFTPELEAQLTEFYRTDDIAIQSAYKKIVGVAIIRSCYDDPNIPNEYKSNVAQRMTNEVFQCMDASKDTYNYLCSRGRYEGLASGTKSAIKEHQKAINEYRVVRKAQRTIKFKNLIKRIGKRVAAKVAVGTATLKATGSTIAAGVATIATTLADVLVPKSVRQKFTEKYNQVKDIVVDKVRTTLEIAETKLNETPVGQKVVTVVKKAASVVREIGQEIKEVAGYVKNTLVDVGQKTGTFIKNRWNKFKAIFA